MGLGAGIFLIAVGAILAFAVNATAGAVDVNTVRDEVAYGPPRGICV
jgi:hypothetical protein